MASVSIGTNQNENADEKSFRPWFADPKFNRFWSHYSAMKDWMNSQELGSNACQDFTAYSWLHLYHQYYQNYQGWMHMNQQYHASFPPYHTYDHPLWHQHQLQTSHPLNQNYYPRRQRSNHGGKVSHSQHSRHWHPGGYRGNSKYATDQSDVDYLDNAPNETPLDNNEEDEGAGFNDVSAEHEDFELSEEMRAFFLQSQKHREQLAEMRKELELSKKRSRSEGGETVSPKQEETVVDYEDEFVAKCPGSKKSKKKLIIGAPLEQPGKRRAEEMKVLYGKDSPAIHGMETAIQMQFDWHCDKKQPSFWPTVPLKM